MNTLHLSVGEPFTSPAWDSNFVVFSSDSGQPVAESETKAYLNKACRYAKQFAVYLVPERFMLMNCQCMCLITPEGKMAGAQKATHLNLKKPVGERSSDVEVISTEFGGISLCVDVDIYHPAVARIAYSEGANIIVSSQHILSGDYSTNRIVHGIWSVSQGSVLYAIGVSNQFACVCAPRSLTERDDGFIVAPTQKRPMTAGICVDDLHKAPKRKILSRRFYAIHRSQLVGEERIEN